MKRLLSTINHDFIIEGWLKPESEEGDFRKIKFSNEAAGLSIHTPNVNGVVFYVPSKRGHEKIFINKTDIKLLAKEIEAIESEKIETEVEYEF